MSLNLLLESRERCVDWHRPDTAAVILFYFFRENTVRVIYKFKANDDNLEATSLLVEGGDIFGFESLPRLANSRATIH